MELANPPVIEVGIEFHFDPAPDKQPWNLRVAKPFIERFQADYPHVEVIQAEQIRIEKRAPGGLPKEITGRISLDRVRARNEEGSRWLQVGDDLLVYNLVRQGGAYPGFAQLRAEALDKFDQFVEHFQPVSVRQVALTYLDLVEVPVPSDASGIPLEDYFRLRVEIPDEAFGPVASVSLQMYFPRRPATDQLTLRFHTVPVSPGQRTCRFQMHWSCECEEIKTLDKKEITRRLEAAHRRLVDCFRASFTDRGWALFTPVGSH